MAEELTQVEPLEEVAELVGLDERERDILFSRYRGEPETLQSIGARWGVTREYIRQIENRLLQRIDHATEVRDTLPVCLVEKMSEGANPRITWNRFQRTITRRRCEECEEPPASPSRWCKEHMFITLPCAECEKLKRVRRAEFVWRNFHRSDAHNYQGRVFCNHTCLGRFWGKHHGWGVHKKGRGRGKQTHCKRDHPLSGDNLYINPKTGARSCKACRRVRSRKSYWRKKIQVTE